ncbi:hypothetical protein [Pseudomonas sp. AP42]|uniref:hypothetical protein n=1 Tax=Pseudomonas sp. AP42 TaxID=1535632 RepID=UPI00084A697E|nr:hypothetical protein [Pseudomonas sp. AP42]OEC58396.1 hypothetical protein A7K61_21365 [Pseudomonas sp. AP42]
MRYRELVRKTTSDLSACVKAGVPEWLAGYAKASMAKADYYHARRRSRTCPLRARAMNELLQLSDVLRHWRRWA